MLLGPGSCIRSLNLARCARLSLRALSFLVSPPFPLHLVNSLSEQEPADICCTPASEQDVCAITCRSLTSKLQSAHQPCVSVAAHSRPIAVCKHMQDEDSLQGPLQTLTLDGIRDLPKVVLQLPTASPLTSLYVRSAPWPVCNFHRCQEAHPATVLVPLVPCLAKMHRGFAALSSWSSWQCWQSCCSVRACQARTVATAVVRDCCRADRSPPCTQAALACRL